ncbi:MAG: adenylyltransferase/cytidyltransferase family protein [Candidatus Thermoplasmatota archaeon]|nr:adenylyltransferase/cytidyltransferase family protein [Candidatus Thermoplasmatota archaeon]|tara:strand:- start:3170 stop:3757 length:588 start_codon:yes stop_codon:yes gene_type:complete
MKTIVFAFGRMNPPTSGHGKLIQKVKQIAQRNRADHLIIASHSQDKNKNPLTPKKKVAHLKKMFPNTKFKASDKINPNFIKQLGLLTGKFDSVIMVAGSDRVTEFQRIVDRYNGKDFTFKSIKVVSAGERDPDAEGVTGISASKMRLFVKNNDFAGFKKGLPPGYSGAQQLFNDVKKGMELKEGVHHSFTSFLKG